MTYDLPKFTHDTRRIVSVNDAGCVLFRCTRKALVDLDMMQLIAHEDFQGLARLRMQVLRERKQVPPIRYLYRRFDGTGFWATVCTTHLGDGLFETILIYEDEA